MEEESFPVKLYIYDISKGLAKQLSPQFLGLTIEGVWHTSVVYKDVEIYYGNGVQQSVPGKTHHGIPLEVVDMGETNVPPEVVKEFLNEISEHYTPEKYDLFDHNCNHMSQQLCEFLVGKSIPDHISSLPQTVLQTPFGQMLRPMIEQSLRPAVTAETLQPANLT
jgi:hypothetical protein